MKPVRNRILFAPALLFFALFTLPLVLTAAEPVEQPEVVLQLSLINGLTPVLVPVVLEVVKRRSPPFFKRHKWVMPVAAPVLGALAEVATNYAALSGGNIAVAAALGLAGVGLRELAVQAKRAASPPAPSTP